MRVAPLGFKAATTWPPASPGVKAAANEDPAQGVLFPLGLHGGRHHEFPNGVYAGHRVVLGAQSQVANPRALEGDPARAAVRREGLQVSVLPIPDSR